jgi:hypothetical protein
MRRRHVTDSGIFGWIWRFNAVAIAVAASGAILVLLAMFGALALTFVQERDTAAPTGLVDRTTAQSEHVSYALGVADALEGTTLLVHQLNRTESARRLNPMKSVYKYESDVVNLLIVDDTAANGRWVFGGVGQAVYSRTDIFDPATLGAEPGKRRVMAMLIHASLADSNKDGTVNGDDDATVMVYNLADGKQHELIKGSIAVISMRQAQDGRILVMYEEGQATMVASYDATGFQLLAKNEVPRLSTAGTN